MQPSVWWRFLLLVFLAGIFLKVYPLAAFALILALVGLLAQWWQRRSLEGVVYRRKFVYRRGFPQEIIPVTMEVENRKFLPVSWLRVEDRCPNAIGPVDESLLLPTHTPDVGVLINLFSLRWFERTRRSYEILLRKRGVYTIGPAQVESGDLFGLFEQVGQEEQADLVTVFPDPLPFKELQLPSEDPFGDLHRRRRLYEDPTLPVGVRDYQPEDDFRHIHWPATAHTGDLQVKVYQPVSAQVLVVCLNVSTLPHFWEGVYAGLLEHLVRVTAAIVQKGLQQGYRVGLVANGSLAHADQPFRVPPGRSPNQQARLFEALAGVTPFVTSPFERFLLNEASRLPYGATLVIVTGLMSAELAETVLRLRQHGRRISVLSFAREALPNISGVTSVHLPYTE